MQLHVPVSTLHPLLAWFGSGDLALCLVFSLLSPRLIWFWFMLVVSSPLYWLFPHGPCTNSRTQFSPTYLCLDLKWWWQVKADTDVICAAQPYFALCHGLHYNNGYGFFAGSPSRTHTAAKPHIGNRPGL